MNEWQYFMRTGLAWRPELVCGKFRELERGEIEVILMNANGMQGYRYISSMQTIQGLYIRKGNYILESGVPEGL